MGSEFKPVGYPTASPYLVVSGAARTIAFLEQVLGAKEIRRFPGPSGSIAHAEVRLEDSVLMISDAATGWPAVGAHVHVYVRDVDAAYRDALSAGAVSVQPPSKGADPNRRAAVKDSGGTTWWISTKVE